MTLSLVGDGPAAAAIRAAIDDTDHDVTEPAPADIAADDPGLAVVVGPVGDGAFATAAEAARAHGTPWLAVEFGGLGGRRIDGLDAGVSGFASREGAPCFDCLRTRVAANGAGEPAEGGGSRAAAATGPATERFAGALAGREAVRLLDGDSSRVLGGVVEVPYAVRRVLPVPYCSCAPERSFAFDLASDIASDRRSDLGSDGGSFAAGGEPTGQRSLEEALTAAERALDDRVGLIREVGEAESFPVPYYLSTLAETAEFSDVSAAPNAAGVSVDWNEAFMKALGESLERYCAGVYRRQSLPHASPGQVPNAVAPDRFVLPDGSDVEGPRRWVPGTELGTGEAVSVPASRAFFPYETSEPTITTGLGLGNGPAEAVVAGLTEVVERDAAILAWYSTFEPLGLRIDDETFDSLVGRASAESLSVTATLLTQDVDVPVVGVAVHRDAWPRFAMGLACDLDPVAAARSACAEALQNWMELRGMGKADAADAHGRIGHFASRPASVDEFVSPDTTVPAGSVADDVPTDPDAQLDALIERVGDAGLDAYAVRTTTRDVAGLGFEAVRVLVPAAQPLFVGTAYFGERAETVPADLGYEPRLRREHHPYP